MTGSPPSDSDRNPGGDLPLGTVFSLLSSDRRRHVLGLLYEHDTPISLPDLAEEVAIREREARITEISAEEVKRVYFSLYHSHVPKLSDVDVVAYDQERDLVEPARNFATVSAYLELDDVRGDE